VIVVDDIHELAPEDAALWRALASRALRQRYLVISAVTARLHAADSHMAVLLEAIGDHPDFIHLKLDSFDLEQEAKLCSSMLGTSDDVSGLAEIIMTRTGGNVGASVELLDELAREGCLKHKVGSWSVTSATSLESRKGKKAKPKLELGELRSDMRDLLVSAAINGPATPASLVQQLAGLAQDDFAESVLELERMGILTWETVGRKAYVGFEDADLPKAILKTANPERTAHLSENAADELLSLRSENKRFDPLKLVEHLTRANRSKEALEFAASEGMRRRDLGEHWIAISLLRQALELLNDSQPLDWPRIAELERLLARTYHFHGDNETALAICENAIGRLSEASLDRSTFALLTGSLLRQVGAIHEDLGDYRAAVDSHRRGWALLGPFSRNPLHYPLWIASRHEVSWTELLAGNLAESAR